MSRTHSTNFKIKYGKEHDCIVFNLIGEKEGFFYYSIVRVDGFNQQEWAKKKAGKVYWQTEI
jgi:hypothetical protein